MANLLMYSMAEFGQIFEDVFNKKKPKVIVEVGSEYAGSTKMLLNYAKKNNAHVYVIEPYPVVA